MPMLEGVGHGPPWLETTGVCVSRAVAGPLFVSVNKLSIGLGPLGWQRQSDPSGRGTPKQLETLTPPTPSLGPQAKLPGEGKGRKEERTIEATE